MKLDLKNFKKIECSDKSTTLEHPNGHKILIAHKNLSPEYKKELDEVPLHLAKGGGALPKLQQPVTPRGERHEYAQKLDEKASRASGPSGSNNTMPGSPTMAKHSYTEPQDQGTDAYNDVVIAALHKEAPPFGALGSSPKQHLPPCINPSCKSYGHPHPNCRCYGGIGGSAGEAGYFAEGGEVEKEYYCDDNRAHRKACEYYKDGGQVKGVHPSYYDDQSGGESKAGDLVRSSDLHHGNKKKAVDEHHKVYGEMKSMPKPKLKGFAFGGEGVADQGQADQPQDPTAQNYGPETIPSPAPSPEMEDVEPPAEDNPNPEMHGREETPSEFTNQPSEMQPAQPNEQPKNPVQQGQEHAANVTNELLTEDKNIASDLDNGHITPQHYSDLFASKSTTGKIGTLFGLLLSGMGSGLSHQPNAIMSMMDNEIKRDLEAQQTSAANKQNLLKINQQALMNKAQIRSLDTDTAQKALALTYMQENRLHLNELIQSNNKLPEGSPLRKQGDQMIALLSQSIDKKNASIAAQAGMASALRNVAFGQNGGMNTTAMKSGFMGPEMQKMGEEVESKRIPGVPGLAERPIPQERRDELQAMDVLDNKAADILSFAKAHKGTLSPSQRAMGAQKAEELINFYNNSIKGGVLTEGRLKWLDNQIKKNPTSIFQDILGNNSRLQEIKNSNAMRRNIVLKDLGFKTNGSKQASPAPIQSEVQMSGGKAYKLDPTGKFMVPVK